MTQLTRQRQRTLVRGISLGIAVMVAVGLAACGGGTSTGGSSASPAKADVLTVADFGNIMTFDPRSSSSGEVRVLANVYETLIMANPPSSPEPYSPVLATSWEKSTDGLVWTFHLRKGVKFQDGTSFNAAAVKYSLNATKNLGLGYGYIWADLKQVQVVDEYTVRLIMGKPLPVEALVSSEYGAYIFSPKGTGQPTKWFDEGHAAGTGPYVMESYKPNQSIVLVRNPDYWGGWKDNQFKKVVLQQIAEPGTARQMVEDGSLDGLLGVPTDSVEAMRNNPNIQIQELPSLTSVPIALNTQHKPLDNVLVRQALAYATPYQDIIATAVNGYGKQSNGPLPEGLWPRDDKMQPYTYNLDKAKELMAQAGYAGSNTKLVAIWAADEIYQMAAGVLLKESWAKIGVQLDLRPMNGVQELAKARGSQAQRQDFCLITWWPGYAHGYDTLKWLGHTEETPTWNLAYWYEKHYDNLIDTAFLTETTDRPKAKAMYDQAQEMLRDQVPYIWLWDFVTVAAWNSKLKFGPMAENLFYPFLVHYYYVTL